MSSDSGPAEPGRPFPETRYSVVRALGDAGEIDPEVRRQAFAALAESYWKPVYKYLRVKWRAESEDAADLTQGFFTHALEKGTFGAYDPSRARFRTFLRTCLDHFAASERKAARREKRGGGAKPLSFDFLGAEAELARQGAVQETDMEEYFHREWVRSLFALAVEDLRARCAAAGKSARFALFERYDLEESPSGERWTYARLGEAVGMSAVQVTNELAAARRDFRRFVLARLAELTASEAELRAEARLVLGIELP
jgi:RNA polymerase sigma factor (sigma-70 family)